MVDFCHLTLLLDYQLFTVRAGATLHTKIISVITSFNVFADNLQKSSADRGEYITNTKIKSVTMLRCFVTFIPFILSTELDYEQGKVD